MQPKFGGHINWWKQQCYCASGSDRNERVPKVPPKAEPKKSTRVPTWDSEERGQAEQKGIAVWVHSENEGKQHE